MKTIEGIIRICGDREKEILDTYCTLTNLPKTIFEDIENRDFTRLALTKIFQKLTDKKVVVTFSDECPTCGRPGEVGRCLNPTCKQSIPFHARDTTY